MHRLGLVELVLVELPLEGRAVDHEVEDGQGEGELARAEDDVEREVAEAELHAAGYVHQKDGREEGGVRAHQPDLFNRENEVQFNLEK